MITEKEIEKLAGDWLYSLEETNPQVLEKKYPLIPMEFGFKEGYKAALQNSKITDIEKLNFYSWTNDGMDENPNGIPSEDVFLLRSDVIAALQNKVSNVSAENGYSTDEYGNKFCNKCKKIDLECSCEYASIVNERKDNVGVPDLHILKQIRNYFGENDGPIFNQTAFSVIDKIIKNTPQNNNVGVNDAIEFAEFLGEQNRICFLGADNVRRWHKLIGGTPLTTEELYKIFKTDHS